VPRLAVFASGSGSNFQVLAEAVSSTRHTLSCLICDKKNAYAFERAQKLGIPSHYVPYSGCSREETEKEILRIIYFSLTGVDKSLIKADYIDVFEKMELSGLTIINNDCKYIPFHDIYQDVFRRVYLPPSISIIGKYLDSLPAEYEVIRDCLLFSNNMDSNQQNEILKSIKNLIRNQKYYTSLYILAPIFTHASIRKTNDVDRRKKSQLGEVCYYNLQFYYAYSVANCDKNIGGKEEFYRLYTPTRRSK